MSLPRHSNRFSIPLLALPLSCTGDDGQEDVADDIGTDTGSETGDGDGDGDGGPCTAPGTVVPEIDPFVPGAEVPLPTCSDGWASDAPLQEAQWVVMIPQPDNYYYYAPPLVKALPGGAALVIGDTSLQWYDGQGGEGPSVAHGFPSVLPNAVVVRDDGHVFIAGPSANDVAIREFADGAELGETLVPTPGETNRIIGLFEFSTDEWLIVGDEFDPMESMSESFFMHVDGQGAEVLRKARSIGYSGYYGYYYSSYLAFAAFDGDDNLLMGTNGLQFIVDPNDGTVLNPTVGLGARDVVGSRSGGGFASASQQVNLTLDGTISLLNGIGINQSTQAYDRAQTSDQLFDVDARPDGGFVAAGVDGIWWSNSFGSSQPLIIAFDGGGAAEWIGRLAISGTANFVSASGDGRVVASGVAYSGTDSSFERWQWIASW
ncbi:hypothetical protein ACNOYE_27995 [Nannocystaceae bacterium ST9]